MDKKDKILLLGLLGKGIELVENSANGSHETDMWKQSLYTLLEEVKDSLVE